MTSSLFLVPPPTPAVPVFRRVPARTGLGSLLAGARDEVIVMSALSADNAAFRHFDHRHVRPGVRYRAIFPDRARATPMLCSYLSNLSLAGMAVRTVAHLPMDTLVIDGALAVLPAEGPGGAIAVLRLPSVVKTAVELFERIWPTAVPLTMSGVRTGSELTARERELLSLLSLGATDESAATQLGISVRTVRRAVADIMDRLGARSRFQAGVKAVDRGWLIDRAS